jgi:hypothetical protein
MKTLEKAYIEGKILQVITCKKDSQSSGGYLVLITLPDGKQVFIYTRELRNETYRCN